MPIKSKHGMKKHPVEYYKHYIISIVAGVDPAFFIAEKDNPAKGVTLTADSLEGLKKNIDETLDYAVKFKINIWQGSDQDGILPNGFVRIKSHGVNFNGFAIVFIHNDDIDSVVESMCNRPLRISKKYRRMHKPLNLAKFLSRDYTLQKGKIKELGKEQCSKNQAR